MATILNRISTRFRQHDWTAVAIELSIVIAGVFLGIQAANWNDDRQNRLKEDRYYAQIAVDLERDVETLRTAQNRSLANDRAAELVIAALDSGLAAGTTPTDIAKSVHYAGFLFLPSAHRRTYDELISTGNLGLLRDGELKTAIADYYESFAELRQWDPLLRQQQADYWSATAGVLPRPLLQAAIFGDKAEVSREDAVAILQRARAVPRMKPMLIGMAAHQARVRRDAMMLEEDARTLLAQLGRK